MSESKQIQESLQYVSSVITKLKKVETTLNSILESNHNVFARDQYPWIDVIDARCNRTHKKNEPPKLNGKWYPYTPDNLKEFIVLASLSHAEVGRIMGYSNRQIITNYTKPFDDPSHRCPPHKKWCLLIESIHASIVEGNLSRLSDE